MVMDVIAQLFGIKDSTTCLIGGTIIDTDLSSGYDNNCMRPPKNDSVLTPQLGIYLYPVIKELQEVYSQGSFSLSMMDTWINGFAVNNKGGPSPDNMCSQANEIMDNCSIMKTPQMIKSSEQDLLQTLFYFFKFYKGDDRILNLESFTDSNKDWLIDKGIVCKNWLENPAQIRYMVRREGKGSSPDYLYMIGGSKDLISDNPSDGIDVISRVYSPWFKKEVKDLLSTSFKEIWHVNNSNSNEYYRSSREFVRLLCGFICIRNYLYYAYHTLKIDTLVEFNGADIKKVSTKKVLGLYEEVYQYCKTIALMLGKGTSL
jgi:hypothetical protein